MAAVDDGRAHPARHRVGDAHDTRGTGHLRAQHLPGQGLIDQAAVLALLLDEGGVDLQDPGDAQLLDDPAQRGAEQGVALVDQVRPLADHQPRGALRRLDLDLLALGRVLGAHRDVLHGQIGQVIGPVVAQAGRIEDHLVARARISRMTSWMWTEAPLVPKTGIPGSMQM
ncbi:hypothetical protein NSA19_07925 [Actinomyces bowdenii]|uniref:hypothetical protein n=1 Tax=Actinomyces bowdenii TaxID=131109 RepID=UPI00214BC327|nr:hypothetical protein [Actinomyces bowdenii]MCR2052773.1 hypothetical protein [Actinomyces bowdenii]